MPVYPGNRVPKSVMITLERTRLARLDFWSQFLANTRQRTVGGARASLDVVAETIRRGAGKLSLAQWTATPFTAQQAHPHRVLCRFVLRSVHGTVALVPFCAGLCREAHTIPGQPKSAVCAAKPT